MHARRLFLYSTVFAPWLLKAAVAQAETEFERYKREQQQGVQALTSEWQVYQKNYMAAYQHYLQQLGKEIGRASCRERVENSGEVGALKNQNVYRAHLP